MKTQNGVRCTQCSNIIDAKAPGVGRFVRGVAVNRAAGGANMITLPVLLDEWICKPCLDLRKLGHEWQQLDLFES